MIEINPQVAVSLVSLLLTYLVHSTLIIVSISLALRLWRSAPADVRVLLWKAAIVLPLLTSSVASLAVWPQFGFTLAIASPSASSTSASLEPNAEASLQHERSDLASEHTVSHERRRSVAALTNPASGSDPPLALGNQADASRELPGPQDQGATAHGLSAAPNQAQAQVTAWSAICLVWIIGAAIALGHLAVQAVRLQLLRLRSSPVTDAAVLRIVNDLAERAGLRAPILIASDTAPGPLTGGFAKSFIVVPLRFLKSLGDAELEALFAHELIHVARRDNLWKLLSHVNCRVFFIQPLNRFARRQFELETEFVADEQAAQLLNHRVGLASCLCQLGEWLVAPNDAAKLQPLATGMASFRSTLGKRVEILLSQESMPTSASVRGSVTTALVLGAVAAMLFAPRATAHSSLIDTPPKQTIKEDPPVKQLTAIALVAGMTMPVVADDKEKEQRPPVTKTTPDELPSGIQRFNGMLVGRLVKKDIEKGKFLVNVDAVPRVWRNSKAENPKSVVGKNVEVDGVSGKWLDALLVVKTGETLEFEARHDGGNGLTFPGELLRKVAPFDPKDYPELPEGFRGFHGAVVADVVKKDPDTFELIVEVKEVLGTRDGNRAKDAKSIEGKQMMLAGFWQRKDQYHGLKVGDRIQAGMRHIALRSDHLTITESVRKTDKHTESSASTDGLPEGIRGFQGALVGRLVSKDVEKGTLEITVDAVPRIWRNNKAKKPRSIVGKNIKIDGVSSRFLDVLLTTRKGETLEVATRHNGGAVLTFPGELFRKVGPYKAEDYPVLPDGFRGFQGQLSAKILKKDPEMYGFIIQVTEVKRSFDGSRAEEPKSIEGKNAILAGFWRRKEIYGELKVGDQIEVGVRNENTGTDVVSVIEGVRKVGNDGER